MLLVGSPKVMMAGQLGSNQTASAASTCRSMVEAGFIRPAAATRAGAHPPALTIARQIP
jgi:hypothetical protein